MIAPKGFARYDAEKVIVIQTMGDEKMWGGKKIGRKNL
jgi:hypothetical protein